MNATHKLIFFKHLDVSSALTQSEASQYMKAVVPAVFCSNGLGLGYLDRGRAPRLSLCHLPLCTSDTFLFKQNLYNDRPSL